MSNALGQIFLYLNMKSPYLPEQPAWYISYLKVGRLLHWSLLLFILESYIYWYFMVNSIASEVVFFTVFWVICFVFSFVHILLVIMDGWSRFQDYKRAKDLFFVHGFCHRIAMLYLGSKCQRAAAIVAAEELGMKNEIIDFFRDHGVKWYHYVPYFMVRDPFFIIRRTFWERTFLEKYYVAKIDFRRLQFERLS